LGILEALGLPFEESMRAFRQALGERLVYFTALDFSDVSPGFGERMAEELERKVEAGACGLKIFKDWHFAGAEFPDHDVLLAQCNRVVERHPDTIFICAHMGDYSENLAYVDGCLERCLNFYVDTTARIAEIGRRPPEEVRAFFLKHQDRVIFGTDLTLGWDAFETAAEGGMTGLKRFYDAHWRFFEMDERQMDHPLPIEGRWKVDAISLPDDVLEKLYVRNAQRLIPGL